MNKMTRRAVLAVIAAAAVGGGYYLWGRFNMRKADHADIAPDMAVLAVTGGGRLGPAF